MIPTKRFVLDPLRSCNLKCKFCYYLHTYWQWADYDWDFDKVRHEIDRGKSRGNNYMDVTGGEPTIYAYICDAIQYALEREIKTCVITNGIAGEDKTKAILDAGVDDFLISRHGLEDTHNFITNCSNAYKRQERFINQILDKTTFRFNCVINHFNEEEIFDIVKEIAEYNPAIVNFINMNPHHEWMEKSLETSKVAANLNVVEPLLNKAIEYLESREIGVNVRYYPMCRIAEEYRRCICNDLHCCFDCYEWDYNIMPKDFASFRAWGVRTSMMIENKSSPCSECDLQWVCGGINKAFNIATGGRFPKRVTDYLGDKNDFYFYRQHNVRALMPKEYAKNT